MTLNVLDLDRHRDTTIVDDYPGITVGHRSGYHTVHWHGEPVARIGTGILHHMLYIEPDAPTTSIWVLNQLLVDNKINGYEIGTSPSGSLAVRDAEGGFLRLVNQFSERYDKPVGPLFHSVMLGRRWALKSPEETLDRDGVPMYDSSTDNAVYCLQLMGVTGWRS